VEVAARRGTTHTRTVKRSADERNQHVANEMPARFQARILPRAPRARRRYMNHNNSVTCRYRCYAQRAVTTPRPMRRATIPSPAAMLRNRLPLLPPPCCRPFSFMPPAATAAAACRPPPRHAASLRRRGQLCSPLPYRHYADAAITLVLPRCFIRRHFVYAYYARCRFCALWRCMQPMLLSDSAADAEALLSLLLPMLPMP